MKLFTITIQFTQLKIYEAYYSVGAILAYLLSPVIPLKQAESSMTFHCKIPYHFEKKCSLICKEFG